MSRSSPFEQHLSLITETLTRVCARHALKAESREDFIAWAHVKLLEDDCRILNAHEGRSSLKTYLAVVVANLFRDYRNHTWGKWRVSAVAKRLGPAAELLETFTVRDGRSFDEAEILITNHHGMKLSRKELEALWEQLPVRSRRHEVGEEALATRPADASAEDRLLEREQSIVHQRLEVAIEQACRDLELEDRVILKTVFKDGLTVAQAARGLGLNQRKLYSRLEKLVDALRKALQRAGLGKEELGRLLEAGVDGLHFGFGTSPESGSGDPSNLSEPRDNCG